jgi:small nuclear ribonucleoprotein (snRNP)-like protein
MKKHTLLLVLLAGLLPLMLPAQEKEKNPEKQQREFFTPQVNVSSSEETIQQLREEIHQIQIDMDRMRLQLREYDDLSEPRIRKEIKRLINYPEKISEITLKNGTTVRGKIISEDLDKIVVQTSLGTLAIVQENIKELKPYDRLHADVVLKGEFEDQRHEGSRVFVGQLENKGLRRADFVRILFRLHDRRTQIVAQDSSFISGEPYTFYSGVVSESSLSPNESSIFRVEVKLPAGVEAKNISYVTYKILFDEFN